jgi:hypothetical protein
MSWRTAARQRWSALRSAQQRIKDLEARIQELTLDRDPNPPDLLDPTRLQKRESAKAEALKELEATRGQVEEAQQRLDDLQARAKGANVPLSWIEEPEPER